MDVAGVTFFIVFVAVILGAVAFFSSDDTIKGEAITTPELPSRASLGILRHPEFNNAALGVFDQPLLSEFIS